MLGFAKWFVIFLLLSLAVGYGTKNWIMAGQIILAYIVVKIVWKFFVDK